MICGKCGAENEAGADFCAACGEFLAWTEQGSAPTATATATGTAAAAGPARSAQHPPMSIDPRTVSVEPGGEAMVRVDVHNRGGVHTEFTLEVTGVPTAWVSANPPVLPLFPDDWGSVALSIRPPRAPSPPAGAIPIRVSMRSAAAPEVTLQAEGAVELGSFVELSVDVAPPVSTGRLAGRHTITVRNEGNAGVSASVRGRDPNDRLRFSARPAAVAASAGGQGQTTLVAKPRRWRWFGDSRSHPFRVVVETDGVEGETEAVMEQRAIGWWPVIAVLVALLLILLVAT